MYIGDSNPLHGPGLQKEADQEWFEARVDRK